MIRDPRHSGGSQGAPQVPPFRFAPVGMTNLRVALFYGALLVVVALLASAAAHAATITIPSGSSQSQIQTYLNSATSTNKVIQFQAGT